MESDAKSAGCQYSHATCSNASEPKKNIALAQMANDVRLLPYLAQLTIRSVPSLKGSVILLGSTGRRCSGNLAFEARD